MDIEKLTKLFSPIHVGKVTTDSPSYLEKLANFAIIFLFSLGGVIVVLAIIWGGFMYITAGGDTAKSERARNTILYAIIGAVVIIMSFVIVKIVVDTVKL